MMAPLDETIFEKSGLFRPRDGSLITGSTRVSSVVSAINEGRPVAAPPAPPAVESSGISRTNTEAIDRPVIGNEPSGVARIPRAAEPAAAPAAPPRAPEPVDEAPLPKLTESIAPIGGDIFEGVDLHDGVPDPVPHSSKPAAVVAPTPSAPVYDDVDAS